MADIEKLLNSENIVYHVVYLDPGVYGYVYKASNSQYHIFISDALSPKGKLELLCHEVHHIIKDAPEKPYYVGLNRQKECCEGQADMFAREAVGGYMLS